MSLSYVIDGPATIWYGAPDCNASNYRKTYEDSTYNATLVGITESGVSVSTQLMTHRLNSDEYGGPEGPPADILTLGATASIQGTLVKWNNAAYFALQAGLRGATPGRAPWPGVGIYSGGNTKQGYAWSFWIVGSKCAYYFPKCELASQPKEWNISALERRMNLNITAYAVGIFGASPHIFFRKTDDPNINKVFPECTVSIGQGGDSGDSGSGTGDSGSGT